jgi:hypothetical protein
MKDNIKNVKRVELCDTEAPILSRQLADIWR